MKLIFLAGMGYGLKETTCEKVINRKYGIRIKYIPGDVITLWRRIRINYYYDKADRVISKRFDVDWYEKYGAELRTACTLTNTEFWVKYLFLLFARKN